MASFNKIILLGNLTRDPEMRYLPNNTPVVEFGMACNRRFKDASGQDREEAMFIDCAAFGKPAEIINQYCHRGDLLFVEGHLKLDQWEDKQGGGKRSKHRVSVDNFQLMPNGKREGGDQPRAAVSEAGQAARRPATSQEKPRQTSPIGSEEHFKEDDLPF
jgi:single-strand DNA-binding protein